MSAWNVENTWETNPNHRESDNGSKFVPEVVDDVIDFGPAETETARAGEEGSDLLIVNNGDGSDFLESTEGVCLLIGADGLDVTYYPAEQASTELADVRVPVHQLESLDGFPTANVDWIDPFVG